MQSVLVVDDEPTARSMLRLILVRAGFEVREAKDGYEALEQVERIIPDVMLLDIMMPGMDGFTVCQILREQENTVDLPIIMLSARADPESVNTGLRVGATKYLTKPVTPDELTRHIREVLSIEGEIPS
ncbi:MAG TPA: two-component system response regulator [Chloroflexi bacterium]|nr:two-component system response regulator [Chloroflexota bacterium]